MLNKLKNKDSIFKFRKNKEVQIKEKKEVHIKEKKDNSLPFDNSGIIKQMKAQGINVDVKLAKAIISNLSSIKATGVVSLNNLTSAEPCEDLPKNFLDKIRNGEYASDIINLHLQNYCSNDIEKYLISNLSNDRLIKTYRYIIQGENRASYVNDYITKILLESKAETEEVLKACIGNVIKIINKNYEE